MKKLKMLTSILLVLVLCLSFVLPVNAQSAKKGSITITGQVTGHKFVAYKIFSADLAEDGKTLSNVEFAHTDDEEAEALLSELNDTFEPDEEFTSAADVADYLSKIRDAEARQEAARKFATAANQATNSVPSIELEEKTKTLEGKDSPELVYTISDLDTGYYLIIDESVTGLKQENSIYSRFILDVVGDVTVNAKIEGKPTLDKTVGKKTGDTITYTPEEHMDSQHNTAKVGDIVPFKLESVFPELVEYTSYKFEVTDTMGEGFDFQNDVTMKIVSRVTVDGEITETVEKSLVKDTDFTVTVNPNNAGKITINYKEILNHYKAENTLVGKTIVIEYSAKVNDKALGNGTPNKNDAYLTYTNNPRTSTEGKTPVTTTETYTYKLTINKVDVEKKDSEWVNADDESGAKHIKAEGVLSDTQFILYNEAGEEVTFEGVTLTTNANGQIVLPGLSNGTYYLTEEKAHDGFNKVIGEIYFTIDAQYNDTNQKVEVKSTEASMPRDAKNTVVLEVIPTSYAGKDVEFTNAGELSLLITNSTGAQLPSTGGVGTVIFTVVGILVMATVVVIAVKSNKKS